MSMNKTFKIKFWSRINIKGISNKFKNSKLTN